jgi:Holliday junction resolvase
MVGEIEAATTNASFDVVWALFDGLGIDVDLVAKGPVVLDPRRHDAVHALCSGYVQRRLEAAGWQVAREVRIDSGRYVGWIDLLAFDQATGAVLVIEIKTRLDDVGAIERSMDWHLREAMGAARRLGWRPRRVAAVLLALASDEVEDALSRNPAVWHRGFPKRATELATSIVDPTQVGGRGLALIDPRSRRRRWLIRARVDGRRTASPYRGYADVMSLVRRAPARRRSSR